MLSRIRSRVKTLLQQQFTQNLPRTMADKALLGLIGELSAHKGIAENIYGEAEVFLIKGALFMSGVRIEESAYEGVGSIWKEDGGQHHYNPNAKERKKRLAPHSLNLPHGLFMPIYLDPTSCFVLRREKGRLFLYLEDLRLFAVEYEKRPRYYDQKTSTGVRMGAIGPHRLQRQVLFEYSAFCRYFSDKTQCLYCGIVGEKLGHNTHYKKYFAVSPGEIAEVARAAYQEQDVRELQITGGVMPEQCEFDYILEVGHAIKEALDCSIIEGSQAVMVPPQQLKQIDALKAAGWQGVSFNLEIWDERLWPGIVPGKAATLSRERWIESLCYAVEVFGKGNVSSVLVAGLEPKRTHWQGVEWLAQHGIYGVPIPWKPSPGSPLEGHQTPTTAWHLEVTARDLDIWEAHEFSPYRHSSGGLHYADMARMREHARALKKRDASYDMYADPRYVIGAQGKLPDTTKSTPSEYVTK